MAVIASLNDSVIPPSNLTFPLKITLPLNVERLPSVIPPFLILRVWLNVEASLTVNELFIETLLSMFNVLFEIILPLKVVSPFITKLPSIFNWVFPDKLPSMTTLVKFPKLAEILFSDKFKFVLTSISLLFITAVRTIVPSNVWSPKS